MVQVDNLQNMITGGDAISAGNKPATRTINTRTKYVLIGSDFSQQE
jgi:hypothetical protein